MRFDSWIAVQPFGGGDQIVFNTLSASDFRGRLQLSADGSLLLVAPDGLLFDTSTGDAQLMTASISGGGGNHDAVITDGLPKGTMNAEGTRFLYAMHTERCTDCVNLPEQLATLDIASAEPGDVPVIADVSIEPAEIGLAGASATTIAATVETSGGDPYVGFEALLADPTVDANLGGLLALVDDGTGEDVVAGDGVYTLGPVVRAANADGEDGTGPRPVRIAAEYVGSDGLRHGIAIDAGTLVVTGG